MATCRKENRRFVLRMTKAEAELMCFLLGETNGAAPTYELYDVIHNALGQPDSKDLPFTCLNSPIAVRPKAEA